MKKQKYSLTSSQRKEIRNRAEKKTAQTDNKNREVLAENRESSAEISVKRKFNWWLIPILAAGLILIACAVILPFSCNPYRDIGNPVARIILDTGDVLEFEIYEDTCPIAATNFIFLAKNKFFDNTIIFDTQNGWVRFGNHVTINTYKEDDKKFIDKLKGFTHSNKLGYRLKKDKSSDADRIDEEGMLTFNYESSSCEFFMSSGRNLQTDVGGVTGYTPTVVGRYLNDSTLDVIRKIAGMAVDENSPNSRWKPPKPTVSIKSVKLYNLDGSKWKNFLFEEYMMPESGESHVNYWQPT